MSSILYRRKAQMSRKKNSCQSKAFNLRDVTYINIFFYIIHEQDLVIKYFIRFHFIKYLIFDNDLVVILLCTE